MFPLPHPYYLFTTYVLHNQVTHSERSLVSWSRMFLFIPMFELRHNVVKQTFVGFSHKVVYHNIYLYLYMLINIIFICIYHWRKRNSRWFFYFSVDNSKYFLPLERIKFYIIPPRLCTFTGGLALAEKNYPRRSFFHMRTSTNSQTYHQLFSV